jgi:DNA modification methylase
MCATSPPFHGLRDYGVEGQIGLEDTPGAWAERLVDVFNEVRRVLRDDGTLWVEIGDSFTSHSSGARAAGMNERTGRPVGDALQGTQDRKRPYVSGMKPKDLVGQPWLLAFALRADGWYLRSEIIWEKPNAMPESVVDRPTRSHSTVFLLSKQARYYYDQDAVRQAFTDGNRGAGQGFRWNSPHYTEQEGPLNNTLGGLPPEAPRGPDGRRVTAVKGKENSEQHRDGERWPNPEGANARTVWTIATEPTPFAHFATWPTKLVSRMIQAGCPPGGTVLDPFAGSGTTLLVARKLGRQSIGIELSESYCKLAAERTQQLSLLT